MCVKMLGRYLCFLILTLLMWVPSFAADTSTANAPASTALGSGADGSEKDSPKAQQTRAYIAKLTEERNQLKSTSEQLQGSHGLLITYSIVISLVAMWLLYRQLSHAPQTVKEKEETSPFPNNNDDSNSFMRSTAKTRKNATITIRNSQTQQAEIVGQVQTRPAIKRSDASSAKHIAEYKGRTDKIANQPVTTVMRSQQGITTLSLLMVLSASISLLMVMLS